MTFTVLGLLADFLLPIWWGLAATVPILYVVLVGRLPQRLVLIPLTSGLLGHGETARSRRRMGRYRSASRCR